METTNLKEIIYLLETKSDNTRINVFGLNNGCVILENVEIKTSTPTESRVTYFKVFRGRVDIGDGTFLNEGESYGKSDPSHMFTVCKMFGTISNYKFKPSTTTMFNF